MSERATTERLVVSARPRFEVEGEEKSRLGVDLLRLEVSSDEEGMARLEAVFSNWGRKEEGSAPEFLYFDRQILDLGKRLTVKAGESDAEATLFDGAITALGGVFADLRPPEIRIHAEDALHRLRLQERTRFYEEEDEAGIASRVANDHGLSPSADASGAQHKELWQVNQNDLAFLRERARAADARLERTSSGLAFTPRRGSGGGDPIKLSKSGALIHFEALADLAHQRTSVFVHGWSVADKTAIHESAGASEIAAEANGGKTGPQVLDDLSWTAVEHVHMEVPATTAEARALATSLALRRGRRFLVGKGVTDGTPALAVGKEVELSDVGELFGGRWHVVAVRHTWSITDGLRTHFRGERVDLGGGS